MRKYLKLFFLVFSISASNAILASEFKVATPNIAPFSYYENDELKGYHIDIFQQLEKLSGLKFNYKVLPYARVKLFIEREKPDLLINFRTNCLKFPTEYEVQGKLFEVVPSILIKKSAVSAHSDIRVGRLIETCNKLMETNIRKDRIVDLASMDQAIEMLNVNKLEGVCGLEPVINYSIRKNKKFHEKLVIYKTQVNEGGLFDAVLCRKKSLSPEIKKKLEDAFPKIKIPVIK